MDANVRKGNRMYSDENTNIYNLRSIESYLLQLTKQMNKEVDSIKNLQDSFESKRKMSVNGFAAIDNLNNIIEELKMIYENDEF